jgi:hypothetical protein
MEASRPNAESAPTTDVTPSGDAEAARLKLALGTPDPWKWWDGKDPLPGYQDHPAIDEPSVEALTATTWKEWFALSAVAVVAAVVYVLAIIGAITVFRWLWG